MDGKYKLSEFYSRPHFINNEELLERTEHTRTYKWSGFDDKHHFDINTKDFPDELKLFAEKPVTYTLNSEMFRVNDSFSNYKDQEVDIALGCSLTFGLGMYDEFTWPNSLGNMINAKVLNLGVNGGGIDQSYINLNKVINKLKIRNVFHLQPVYARYYAYLEDHNGVYSHVTLNPIWENAALESMYSEYYRKHILTNIDYINFNHKRGTDAIRGLCAKRGINYFFIDETPFEFHFVGRTYMKERNRIYQVTRNPRIELPSNDIPSRELIHPTKLQYEKLAKEFYYQVKKSII